MEEIRKYTTVSANDSAAESFTVPSGKVAQICCIGANAVHNSEVKVDLKFGTYILLTVHGDAFDDKIHYRAVGDGSKTLSVNLVNDSSSTETFGGFIRYELVNV